MGTIPHTEKSVLDPKSPTPPQKMGPRLILWGRKSIFSYSFLEPRSVDIPIKSRLAYGHTEPARSSSTGGKKRKWKAGVICGVSAERSPAEHHLVTKRMRECKAEAMRDRKIVKLGGIAHQALVSSGRHVKAETLP